MKRLYPTVDGVALSLSFVCFGDVCFRTLPMVFAIHQSQRHDHDDGQLLQFEEKTRTDTTKNSTIRFLLPTPLRVSLSLSLSL